ncbi:hypothetical protein MHYP_G00225730 [Metynnis hypsauchen]
MEQKVREILASGVIKLSGSPWAVPVILAMKKDDSCHFCVDCWWPNAVTNRGAGLR